jgi:hypothetical protein
MKFFYLILIAIIFSLTSCSKSKPQYDVMKEDGIPLHGNFCGKNIPTIEEKDMSKRIEILESIEPTDSVDLCCKKHDICYGLKGYYNEECDIEIINELSNVRDNLSNDSCKKLTLLFESYFHSSTENYAKQVWNEDHSNILNDTLTRGINVPLIAIFTVYDTTVRALAAGVSTAGVQTIRTVFSPKDNKNISEPVGYELPERYYICE